LNNNQVTPDPFALLIYGPRKLKRTASNIDIRVNVSDHNNPQGLQ